MWFRRWLRPEHARLEAPSKVNGRLTLELDGELSARLQLAAHAQNTSPEALATGLLAHGLKQKAQQAQIETALAALTPREQQVARLTLLGHTNRQIAEKLVISHETVKTHMRHVLDKFGVRSKADLRLLLRDQGSQGREDNTV